MVNLCFESKLNKEQQMLGYLSMCLYEKSPPLSSILDEWKSFESTFLKSKIETNVVWNLINGVCWQEWRLFEKTQAKTSRMILNSMDASYRSLLCAWLVHSSICTIVSVILPAILRAGDFFIFSPHLLQLSSKVLWSILAGHRWSRLNWEIFSDFQVSDYWLVFVLRAD